MVSYITCKLKNLRLFRQLAVTPGMGKTLPSVAEYFHVSVLGSFDFMRVVAKSTWSTNARLGEKARPAAYFFVTPRHFDFLTCETETSKCFKYELETFRRYPSYQI